MEDEGCTTYSANIDQMTEGHRFIWETFGARPRFGWQIDPFGGSSVVHEQFALMGFDGTVVDRVDSIIKDERQQNKQLEFVWQPSHSYGDKLQIFTHMMGKLFFFSFLKLIVLSKFLKMISVMLLQFLGKFNSISFSFKQYIS